MPLLKVFIHFVWSTKNREPFLYDKNLRSSMWAHIKMNSIKKGIFIDCINGYSDHCHCVVSLGVDQTLSKMMQLIKGESAFWINKENVLNGKKFEWQDGYYASSVSESLLERTRAYINNQEHHHAAKTFDEEAKELMKKEGFGDFK